MNAFNSADFIEAVRNAASHPHPRLLATKQTFQEILGRSENDELLRKFLQYLLKDAEIYLSNPPAKYEKIGRRLLGISRLVLRRILSFSIQYHLTGREEFAERAIREMENAASFADWNPTHALDVSEMTTALAIGLDWLHEKLTPEQRRTINHAIKEKGLRPNMQPNQEWHTGQHNWNQVCLGGLLFGALALAEEEAEFAAEILGFVCKHNVHGLLPYQPAGIYPEGRMYWSYGTTYQVLILEALQTAIGDDWGLSHSPGFLESATATLQMTGPSGRVFNFSDGLEHPDIDPAFYWFARRLQSPALLKYELPSLECLVSSTQILKEGSATRFLPLIALWWPDRTGEKSEGKKEPSRYWYGIGRNPLGVFRSSWNSPNAAWLAFKGGMAAMSHGHMDVGSFVFEAGGVRWASDLGVQDYHSLESQNIKMWDFKQEGERWQVFRLGPHSHNTLTINGHLHDVKGSGTITHFSEDPPAAILDLSSVFKDHAQSVRRGFQFDPVGAFLVRDEITGLKRGDEVRWAMVTKATIELQGETAILSAEGKRLVVESLLPQNNVLQTISLEQPLRPYDAPNPGYTLLTIKAIVPSSGSLSLAVCLSLAEVSHSFKRTETLDDWRVKAIS